MNQRHLKALELDKILAMCSQHAVSQRAKEKILDIAPAQSYDDAKRLLSLTEAANSLSIRFSSPGIRGVKDPQSDLSRASRGAMLTTRELLDIQIILNNARTLSSWYNTAATERTALEPLFEALTVISDLEKEIRRCIPGEDEIADNASTNLSDIRRKIRGANQKARSELEKITRSNKYEKYLQEQIVTIRNGRFVVPVRAEYRSEVKGLVHDTSASGSTYFIEPMAVVELNNKIKELEIEQQKEIDRIMMELSAQCAKYKLEIISNYDSIVQIDIIFAKSKLADATMSMAPTLVEKGRTNLMEARHPLIAKDEIVPINIEIGGEFDTLVITGPNTGGKTVALKTIGLLTLMAMSGFMIPASSRSQVSFYSKVLADIGDEQSIEQSLSTFSGHMTNIVAILNAADENSLVLIDELGAGTDPVEGAALAVSIISQLRSQKSAIVATTHYSEMKMYALQTDGVENASCEFDVATLRPTYRLLIGTPGRSNAFAISQRLGLPQEVIEDAQQLVSSEDRRFEDVVTSLEETRHQLEQERLQAQNLRLQAAESKRIIEASTKKAQEKSEEIVKEAQERARTLLERTRYQAETVMEELEEVKKQQEKESFSSDFNAAQSKIRTVIDDMEETATPVIKTTSDYKLPRPLERTDRVFLVDFNTEGMVLSPADNKGNLIVQAGILETKVHQDRVRLIDESKTKVTLNNGAVRTQRAKSVASNNAPAGKLDLRGFDRNEAALELDRFLDSSVMRGLKTLTIVHGKGTGALREMTDSHLQRHPQVESYRLGEYGEGGSGVTIVELV